MFSLLVIISLTLVTITAVVSYFFLRSSSKKRYFDHLNAAYLVGGGISSLNAAVHLVNSKKVKPSDIHIFEESHIVGGALDGCGNGQEGFVARGGRMLDQTFSYQCFYDLLSRIPAEYSPMGDVVSRISAEYSPPPTTAPVCKTLLDEVLAFNDRVHTNSGARLVGGDGKKLPAHQYGLNAFDRMKVMLLQVLPEWYLGARSIKDYFPSHFFTTNFWCMWRSMFAFQDWHSVVECRRYMLRFQHAFPTMHNMTVIRRTPLNQYECVVAPTTKWLKAQGVQFHYNTGVIDCDFDKGAIVRLHLRGAENRVMDIDPRNEVVLVTVGSMTADATLGGMNSPAVLKRSKQDNAWTLWERMAVKQAGLGRPSVFCGRVDESKWMSFTVTFRDRTFFNRMEEFSGNKPGTGALVTMKDSSWLITVVLVYQPHFSNQDTSKYQVCWGYALFPDKVGDYVHKRMCDCTGAEILTELLHQLHLEKDLPQTLSTSTCIPCMMPYITSQFECRRKGDRPPVIPSGSVNYALMGQFVEMAEDIVFTVEYACRSALVAVHGLLGESLPGVPATPPPFTKLTPAMAWRNLCASFS